MEDKEVLKKRAQERILKLSKDFETQQDFADYCGVSKYSISQYVNGTNAPGNISAAKIAGKFGLDPLWVMGFDVPMEQPKKRQGEIGKAAEWESLYFRELTDIMSKLNEDSLKRLLAYVKLLYDLQQEDESLNEGR